MQRSTGMAKRSEILLWLRRRRERVSGIEADANLLIRELGSEAYSEARTMERRATSPDERRRWRDIALAVASKSGKRVGLDTATRMAMEADFTDNGDSARPGD